MWGAPRAVPAGARGRGQDVCEAGSQRGALAPVGDVGSAAPPLMPAAGIAVPFPSAHCRALLHSQRPQLLPDCSQGHSWAPREGSGCQGTGSDPTGTEVPLDTPIPPQAHRGRRSRNTAGAAGALQTSGISQEERGRKEWEVHGCCSPREHIIILLLLLLMQRSKAWTGPKLLSS